jgi:serine phosphatase RsbU (regulator of sigma subunit)/ligand-binding sensor domain-containing protein
MYSRLDRMIHPAWIMGLLLFGLSLPARAHHEKTAYAIPLEDIVIDGLLDDWPEEMAIYPIDWVHPTAYKTTPPDGPKDFTGSFRVGFDPKLNLLYLAIVVEDEDLVIHTEAPNWAIQDLCEVYVDADHSGGDDAFAKGAPFAQQFVMVAAPSKTYSTVFDNPSLTAGDIHRSGVRAEVFRAGATTVYEWALPLFMVYPNNRLQIQSGKTMGFDVVVADADGADAGNWIAWNPGGAKYASSDRLGDLMFAQDYRGREVSLGEISPFDYRAFGTISGKVVTKKENDPYSELVIGVYDEGKLLTTTMSGPEGEYQVRIPPGTYSLQPGRGQGVLPFSIEIVLPPGGNVRTELEVALAPVLGRLSFWPLLGQIGKFDSIYENQIVPILRKYQLVESSERPRKSTDWIFSRLFEFKSVTEFYEKLNTMQTDSVLVGYRGEREFVVPEMRPDSLVPCRFEVYSSRSFGKTAAVTAGKKVRAGKGKTVKAGRGREGVWYGFGAAEGIPLQPTIEIFQDRKDNLWFGTAGGGVIRYDGVDFITYTTKDGLVNDVVRSIAEDSIGNLWFGTNRGVSRFDGREFTSFSTRDGLNGDAVSSIVVDPHGDLWFSFWSRAEGVSRYDGKGFTTFMGDQIVHPVIGKDRAGALWFGTYNGAIRYDGAKFDTLTTEDGLADNSVGSIYEDRERNLWFCSWEVIPFKLTRFDGERFETFVTEENQPFIEVERMVVDREGNPWFKGFRGNMGRFDGEYFSLLGTDDGLLHGFVSMISTDREGNLWICTERGLNRCDAGEMIPYTTAEGLVNNYVSSVFEDKGENLWIGTAGGISLYDRTSFLTFTTEDGLPNNIVRAVLEDQKGSSWFGTEGGGYASGVTRYDGGHFTTFTIEDGLAHNDIISMIEDRNGILWFGTLGGGVSKYDGIHFTNYTTKEGLASNSILDIAEDRNGGLWFAAGGGGISRYQGGYFTSFSAEDGLEGSVISCFEDRNGGIWVGMSGGNIGRFDGTEFATFSAADGMLSSSVRSLVQDKEGNIWAGTWGGISRWDGGHFTNFTTENGLTDSRIVWSGLQDRKGHLWFGTCAGGVIQYDGFVFQNLLMEDGLPDNYLRNPFEDRNGDIWLATEGGITRYRPSRIPPKIVITNVIADQKYGDVERVSISSSQQFITFEFVGKSSKTPTDKMIYVYRLEGFDEDWLQTRENQVDYANLSVGEYVFQTKAVDRDLNYSEVAEVELHVHPPYEGMILIGGLGMSFVGLVIALSYAVKRRRELRQAERALLQELEEELQTAHDMQMGLMPTESPMIQGFDISGRCLPANHVGGDFFQYFPISDNRLAISLADVTGHAMEAAVPVMMFSGVLESEIKHGESLVDLFSSLNQTLHKTLDKRTFVCFTMGELDTSSKKFRLSNGGCPYPYHYKASSNDISELQVDAYPLGVRAETDYPVIETQLEDGDRIVFCSDGIIEAENSFGEIFGFERTAETIRNGCKKDLTAPQLLDHLINEVKTFSGDTPQGDDQTVVVLQVES